MKFTLLAEDASSKARAGMLRTAHGNIPTPVFMPVGTSGSVKSVEQTVLENEIRAPILLGNAYHLYLRPGADVIYRLGGLHRFISWDRPILTDSGGFQVYSLSDRRKLSENGVVFRSHVDGSPHLFTPEKVVTLQRKLGPDIMMMLDECTPYPSTREYTKSSMELTHRWAKRAKSFWEKSDPLLGHVQSLLPIVQGGVFADLRKESASFMSGLEMEGNAIGGLSVGEPAPLMYEMADVVTDILPRKKVRYLMGVGTPVNILECIALGVDMFDCVLPTRNGRNGMLFTTKGIINIKNAKYKKDDSPIDDTECFVDRKYSRAYLRHLFNTKENLAGTLASIHNLYLYQKIVTEAREHILTGDFMRWKSRQVKTLGKRL